MIKLSYHELRHPDYDFSYHDFGMKYTNLDDANHLLNMLKQKYRSQWIGIMVKIT